MTACIAPKTSSPPETQRDSDAEREGNSQHSGE
jgi:hypothetical protein